MQPEEQKFFAAYDTSISQMAGQARKRAIARLPQSNPELAAIWQAHRRGIAAIAGFIRGSGRFPLNPKGKVNTYSVFAETARNILHPTGRAGLIVPSGIATDDTTKFFFADAVNGGALVSLYDFENGQGIFPGVHRSYKFCLLTLSGDARPVPQAEFAFFLRDTAQLIEPNRRFALTADDFALFNPNTRTSPVFRARRDMEIARKMYHRAGVFWRESKGDIGEHNPWGITMSAMFNITSDSDLFRRREDLAAAGWNLEGNIFTRGNERYIPLYEAKMFQQYDHRYATFEGVLPEDIRKGKARSMGADEKVDANAVALPRYWIHEKEVAKKIDNSKQVAYIRTEQNRTEQNRTEQNRTKNRATTPRAWRIGTSIAFRHTVRATDVRTNIFAMIPPVGLGHSGSMIIFGSSLSET